MLVAASSEHAREALLDPSPGRCWCGDHERPQGVDSEKLTKHLFKEYGIKLVGGQDAAKGKIFRIAHLGYFDDFDMLVVIGAVERGLHDLGAKVELGAGLAAAQRSFAGQGK